MESSEQGKKIVPKFASFTAKKPLPASSSQQSEGRSSMRHAESTTRKRVSHSKPADEHHRSRHHESQSRPREDESLPAKTSKGTPKWEQSDIFFEDTKGDESNVVFGGTNQWAVPKFFRRGAGRIVGADPSVKINREESTEKFLILDNTFSRPESARTGLGQRKLRIPAVKRLIKPFSWGEVEEDEADFIGLGESRTSRREFQQSTMEQIRDLDRTEALHPDSSEGDEPEMQTDEDRHVIQQNAELNTLVRTQPRDLQHWLGLIAHQEAMMRIGYQFEKTKLSRSQRLRLADLRISVYEEALKKTAGQEHDQVLLWKGLLEEATHSQEHNQILRRWRSAIDSCPNSVELRIRRLDYIQSQYIQYGFEGCKREFCEVMSFLKQRRQTSTGQEAVASLVFSQNYVLLRLTSFLREAGYHELSFALWQSVMDISIACKTTTVTDVHVSTSFGEFWDSEALRLGEGLTGGWREYLASPDRPMPEGRQSVIPQSKLRGGRDFRSLVDDERHLEGMLALPGRMIDDYDESDTFHLVMFSDMEDILSTIILDQDSSASLLSAFLCFFGLPVLPSTPADCRKWWSDPFIFQSTSSLCHNALSSVTSNQKSYPNDCHFHINTVNLLLRNLNSRATRLTSSEIEVLLRMLRQIIGSRPLDDELTTLLIGLTAQHVGVDAAAKEAKMLLKANPTNIPLYNALFLIEIQRGNIKSAAKMISTPLNMRDALPQGDCDNLVLLWRTWIWHFFQENRISESIHLLSSLGNDQVTTPDSVETLLLPLTSASMLRGRQWIEQGLQTSIRRQRLDNFVLYADIGMLLMYLESDQNLSKVIHYLNQTIYMITRSQKAAQPTIELLHQSRTIIVSHHTKYIRPYIPTQIQHLLKKSMALFPQNTLFLQEYANQELSFGLNDRLRNILPIMTTGKGQDTLPNWLFAIWFANRRCLDLGGTPHAVRAMLDRAVESEKCQYSAALWLQYLVFEEVHGNLEKFRVVLNRALTKLPWVKNIVLRGLAYLDGKIEHGEMLQLYSLLEEREIRMHRDHV